ncbi:ABC-2 type transport system permease protein [Stackebrandtia endophytica]|uniref:ABC-2 type transport system permease protein n=1 Tax=Stackebrandtia endophytica TaxID=1496996 RepID=A0A543AX13_9ACTN|nr:ABC transporter permease [Stackebrandtia endophytica]TQL77112.1 ABC-2 type transport system permease protein [Stackebrandtia endophytica]
MNPTWAPYRAGLSRGWSEFKHAITTPAEVIGTLFPSVIAIIVMIFLRDVIVDGASVSLASMTLPSLLGMNIAFSGLMGIVGQLTIEREDGTLLRNKAVPGGMTGYLVGITISVSTMSIISLLIVLAPGMFLFDDVRFNGFSSVLTFIWVVVLGLFATMPIGAVFGSMFGSPRQVGLVMLPVGGLVAISGIFYPITALPEWVQWIGQTFPIYWLGLGMRSALLPAEMAAVEIGESWRHLETAGVLGLWTIIGLAIAPIVLRRMARRESGSAVAARREKAMQSPIR